MFPSPISRKVVPLLDAEFSHLILVSPAMPSPRAPAPLTFLDDKSSTVARVDPPDSFPVLVVLTIGSSVTPDYPFEAPPEPVVPIIGLSIAPKTPSTSAVPVVAPLTTLDDPLLILLP